MKNIYEMSATVLGWRLDSDGAFRHPDENLDDGSPASFWYDGDWEHLCAEANIEIETDGAIDETLRELSRKGGGEH